MSKMTSDRILAWLEQVFDECLVYHGDRGSGRRITRVDPAPHQHTRSDRIEILRVRPNDRGSKIQEGLSLQLNTPAVVVVLHRRIRSDTHFHHTRQCMEA